MLYDQPQHAALPEGWIFRLLIGFAAMIRSFGALLSMITSTVLLSFIFVPILPLLPFPRRLAQNMLQGIPALLMCLLITWLLLRFAHKARLVDLGLGLTWANLREFAICLGAGAFALSLTVTPLLFAGLGHFTVAEARLGGLGGTLIFLVLLLVASIGEELVMRGYAFQTLVEPLHLLGALLFTSVVFAAIHLGNPGANEFTIANTFLAGCALGLLLVLRRSLWAAIGAHFGWNLATILFGLNVSGLSMPIVPFSLEWKTGDLWTGGRYGPEGGLICTVVLSLVILLETLFYYSRRDLAPVLLTAPPADAE